MTIHLSSLDEAEHLSGPFSEEANRTLATIDGLVEQLMGAALRNDPTTTVIIVSDHGFARVDHAVNLSIPFIQAGLIQLGKGLYGETTVTSWKAAPWSASGLAAVMLHEPADAQTRIQVHDLLTRVASNPANGIAAILGPDEIKLAGGFPDAAYVVAMKPGYTIGSALSGALVNEETPVKGTHGYLPSFPEMRASFFALGPNVSRRLDLGLIDMRQIAPTVATILGVSLPAGKQPPLTLKQ